MGHVHLRVAKLVWDADAVLAELDAQTKYHF